MIECPTCEGLFETERGMKQHHAVVHGESLAGVRVSCSHCGKAFRKRSDHAQKHNHHFCSNRCDGRWKSENLSGENNPQYSQVATECTWCGSPISVQKSRFETYEHQFCSGVCESKWRSEYQSGADKVEVRECSICGDEVERYPSQFAESGVVICSAACKKGYFSGAEHVTENLPSIGQTVTVECGYCGESLRRGKSRVDEYENQYCDRQCASKALRDQFTGEKSPRYNRVETSCATCGDVLLLQPNQLRDNNIDR